MNGFPMFAHPAMQGVLGLAALAMLAGWPPRRGPMLIVPVLGSADAGGPVRAALAAGATLLGRGPVRNSLIVDGDLARLRKQTAGTDLVVLAAPPAGCGARTGTGA